MHDTPVVKEFFAEEIYMLAHQWDIWLDVQEPSFQVFK
jgi:hypothetical protein